MAREQFRAIPKILIRAMPQNLKSKIVSNYIRHITLKKYDVVHALAKYYNYHSYLEICTATTGNYFHKIDRSKFKRSFRLMYNCPADFDDGLPIDYRHSGFDISSSIKTIRDNKLSIDVCLVDGWHTYDNAFRDLEFAYDLLADGGALVVHDCLPPSLELASPNFMPGLWCGVSYKAYVDFLLKNKLSDYFTGDTDYGCGIIYKKLLQPYAGEHQHWASTKNHIREQLTKADGNYDKIYQLITENKIQLLNLISVNQFLENFVDSVDLTLLRKIILWLSPPALTRLNY